MVKKARAREDGPAADGATSPKKRKKEASSSEAASDLLARLRDASTAMAAIRELAAEEVGGEKIRSAQPTIYKTTLNLKV